MEPVQVVQTLECELTDKEVAEHADQASQKEAKRAEAEGDESVAKEQAKAAKERASVVDEEIRSHLRKVRHRKEYREVECEISYDPDDKKMITTRHDTGAIIDSRPPYENELQGELRMLPGERSSDEQDRVDRQPAGA